ncbi:MAG: hypothetical protein ACRDL2_12125, partial [Gaiellaceae bacterium]
LSDVDDFPCIVKDVHATLMPDVHLSTIARRTVLTEELTLATRPAPPPIDVIGTPVLAKAPD